MNDERDPTIYTVYLNLPTLLNKNETNKQDYM